MLRFICTKKHYIVSIVWCFIFCSNGKMQRGNGALMLPAAGKGIDPGGFHRSVAKDICQMGQIFLHFIKAPCEKVTQIVRKYFAARDAGARTEGLHIVPYI